MVNFSAKFQIVQPLRFCGVLSIARLVSQPR